MVPGHGLHRVGGLEPAARHVRPDTCSKACTDWYGNTRPIFYRGRVFARMGHALVEAALSPGAVQASLRVNLLDSEER